MNQGWRIEETSPDLSGVLARFFAQCDGIVGAEANYQALLVIELEKAYPGRVRREHKLPEAGRGGLDVVVLDGAGEAEYVFELKGGAYNTRNALQDVFDVDGVCSDMLRLAKLRVPEQALAGCCRCNRTRALSQLSAAKKGRVSRTFNEHQLCVLRSWG